MKLLTLVLLYLWAWIKGIKYCLVPFLFLVAISCTSSRFIPDRQIQLTLIRAYKEDKSNSCGMPHNPEVFGRTWHCDLLKKNGDTLRHHYFTVSQVKQSWLRPGDQYTLQYSIEDSCKHPYIYAKLKWNK